MIYFTSQFQGRSGSLLLILMVLPFLATCSRGGSGSSSAAPPTPQPTSAATPTTQPTSVGTLTPQPTSPGTLTPQPTSGPMLTPQQRTASMDAVDTKLASLPGTDIAADNKALAQFIASRPEFSASGTTNGDLTVWGKWSDGVLY